MTSDQHASLRKTREATIDALCESFARETLSMAELEQRLEEARSARTREELNRLLHDLPEANVPMKAAPKPAKAGRRESPSKDRHPARTGERRPALDEPVRDSGHLAIAIMGGTRRAGRWAPPADMAAIAMMGGVELDFTDAVLDEGGVTEINCFAFWGGVEITVPPDVRVESAGFALMGGFDQEAEIETRPGPDAPTIRVNGFALMGAVEIKVAGRGG